MSLKPPAAIFFIVPSGKSDLATRFTNDDAITCGTWLIAAVIKSCSSGFKETDNAKRSSLPNEYLGVYLDVGCSVECQVGYFVPKNEESDASKLFFELGPNPDKVQYIYPR